MNALTQFIEINSSALLDLLVERSKGKLRLQDSFEFVDAVLDDFSSQFSGIKLPSPCPDERTFWCTLYELEEATEVSINLASNPDHSTSIRPYQNMVEENLTELENALKYNIVLDKFFATRPGEWDTSLDEMDLLEMNF